MTESQTTAAGWVMTASGLPFNPLQPRVSDVRIEDIAHGLAATSRFGCRTRGGLRPEPRSPMPPPAPGEDRDDVPSFPVALEPWGFHYARAAFLRRFDELQAGRTAARRKRVAV